MVMKDVRGIDVGVFVAIATLLVTIALAIVGFSFWLGTVEARLGRVDHQKLESQLDRLERVAREGPYSPVGTIIAFAGEVREPNDVPAGWLLCDGSAIPNGDQYQSLRDVLSKTTWGQQSSDKTPGALTVPDLRGVFLRGVDDPDGSGGASPADKDPDASNRVALSSDNVVGDIVGSYQVDQFFAHKHELIDPEHKHPMGPFQDVGGIYDSGDARSAWAHFGAPNKDTGTSPANITMKDKGGSETRPKNISVNYLIKY